MARNRRSTLKSLSFGLLAAVLFTLAAMLLLAVALVYLRFSDSLLTLLNQIIKYAAILIGVCVAVQRSGEKGLATGLLIALLYIAIGCILYVVLGGGSFSAGSMLGEMLLGSAVGAVTGALRANMRPKGRLKAVNA